VRLAVRLATGGERRGGEERDDALRGRAQRDDVARHLEPLVSGARTGAAAAILDRGSLHTWVNVCKVRAG
jgi:hypothetical protein